MKPTPTSLLALLFAAGIAHASSPGDIKGFAPVSVSSANYRSTPRDELLRTVEVSKTAINPDMASLQPLPAPQHFIFMPGETFDADLKYDQVIAMLTPALGKKGYVNAADANGAIREPARVSLVLRVSFGERLWRLPTVRTESLTWNDGLVPRPRGTSLQILGGEKLWDQRAGGNDAVFAQMAANSSASALSLGTASGGAAPGSSGDALNLSLDTRGEGTFEYGNTREFDLIVVDAFDYHELKANGVNAKRLWSTFVAAPKMRGQKFSEMAATLIRNATPYFGETTKGLQVYSDARAEVKIGEAVEVKDEPKK